jgi:hypothetical protein
MLKIVLTMGSIIPSELLKAIEEYTKNKEQELAR